MAKLYFYYSAMNAGKTTILLQSSYNYNERGMETILYTPTFDNRYETGEITSRIGLKKTALTFDNSFDFFYDIKNRQINLEKLSCVLVDEAQFLTKGQVKQLTNVVDQLSVPVLTYGLRTDFLGDTFEGSHYLLAWSDNIIEIKTICFCGRKATRVARIDENGIMIKKGKKIEIGGNDRYISLCRKHYNEGKFSF
ncbi:MAG: thymidine kinase [Alphaproteobacteria bacterium]